MAGQSDRERFEQLSQKTRAITAAERAAQTEELARQQAASDERRRRDEEETQLLFSHLQQFRDAVPPKIGLPTLVEHGSIVPALRIEKPDGVEYVVFSVHGNPYLAARCREGRFELIDVNGERAAFGDRRALMDRLIEYLNEVNLAKTREHRDVW